MFNVVIVEDDPIASRLNRRFLEADGRFKVVAEFSSGRDALRWFVNHKADLVMLDVFMPILMGTELLRELRMRGVETDAIMVTAAHDPQTLNDLLKMGIMDYLVKPFSQRRFRQALDTFCRNRATLEGSEQISQSEIDRLMHAPPAEEEIPKGLQKATLDKIRSKLKSDSCEITCEALAVLAELSTVTVRRYLNYLLENGEVLSRINYDTGGRPSVAYHIAGIIEKRNKRP